MGLKIKNFLKRQKNASKFKGWGNALTNICNKEIFRFFIFITFSSIREKSDREQSCRSGRDIQLCSRSLFSRIDGNVMKIKKAKNFLIENIRQSFPPPFKKSI